MISFKYSKTVQFNQRHPFVVLPWGSDVELCPVLALVTAWRNAGCSDITNPLLPIRHGSSISPLLQSTFSCKLKEVLHELGLLGYSGHSFRRGGATHALSCGVPSEIIKAQGDWSSLAYLDYIHVGQASKRVKFIVKMM